MGNQYAKNETEYLEKYKEKGYTENFRFENNKLVASENDGSYEPSEITVVAEHRFEGMSNPSDLSILYVLETKDDLKGTIVAAYGPNGNLELAEFFKEIPEDQIKEQSILEN